MANGVELLRRLEPAVRPDGLSAPRRPVAAPIEQRSFDSVLEEAQDMAGRMDAPGEARVEPGDAGTERPSPLPPLGRLDRVENAALRELIAAPRRS